MKKIVFFLAIAFACGLLLAIQPAQASRLRPLDIDASEIQTSIILSNEAPGYLVGHLISLGHGGETLFQVLGYLKGQSGGVIPDAFYNQVAAAPVGSEVFTATLGSYAGLVGGIEICGDGTLYIPSVEGNDYRFETGYYVTPSLDESFRFTAAQDPAYNIFTHDMYYGGTGQWIEYYAFAIAWKNDATAVDTMILSNEAPGYLVDHLIDQGHGGETLLQVLGYLKSQSGGVIPDAFYNQVAAAPGGSLVFSDTLGIYAGLIGGIEIGEDGTISIPSFEAKAYANLAGYATTPSLDGSFYFTTAQDAAHTILTHCIRYGGGVSRDYFAFTIAWREGLKLYMPLVNR